jgi:hypothetical protein
MTDFPQAGSGVLPLHLHTLTEWGVATELRALGLGVSASMTWVANQATYMPMSLPWAYPVRRVFWVNGSVVTTTNVDFGIYTPSGKRIYSTGSTTMAGASSTQYVTPATTFVLPAGRYYFAWTCDGTTNRAWGNAPPVPRGAMVGCLSQSTALPLPASATPVRYIATGLVLCGVTRTGSGF